MKNKDKEWINQRYSDRIKGENFSYEALRSGPWERREMRFHILREIGVQAGDSVLDLGCGYGDLYDYFKSQNIEVKYTGYDINPDFIAVAKERHPEVDFKVLDVVQEEYPEYDWVLSTTCFNLKLREQDNYEFVEELFASVFAHAKKGVAIDFLTDYVDFKTDHGFHYSPEKVFSIAKKFSKRVTLRHDYPIFEFCMYLYPDFKGWAG